MTGELLMPSSLLSGATVLEFRLGVVWEFNGADVFTAEVTLATEKVSCF